MSKSDDLSIVRKRIIDEMKCPLKDSAKNLVFGKGNPDAKIMFIGEAPGRNEDIQGEPFVGQAGKQLDELLKQINLSLGEVYIANILKYRPPENRAPAKDEIVRHAPYLVDQIKIISPEIIITLGNYATKFVLANFNTDEMKNVEGITKIHGTMIEKVIDGKKYIILPMYHPAAILYNRGLQSMVEDDFKKAGEMLKRNEEKND